MSRSVARKYRYRASLCARGHTPRQTPGSEWTILIKIPRCRERRAILFEVKTRRRTKKGSLRRVATFPLFPLKRVITYRETPGPARRYEEPRTSPFEPFRRRALFLSLFLKSSARPYNGEHVVLDRVSQAEKEGQRGKGGGGGGGSTRRGTALCPPNSKLHI